MLFECILCKDSTIESPQRETHINQICPYVEIMCPRCLSVVPRGELATHLCDAKKVECDICLQNVYVDELQNHQENECLMKQFECQHKTCAEMVYRYEWEDHKVNCGERLVKC